jgi:hypothetical protein
VDAQLAGERSFFSSPTSLTIASTVVGETCPEAKADEFSDTAPLAFVSPPISRRPEEFDTDEIYVRGGAKESGAYVDAQCMQVTHRVC